MTPTQSPASPEVEFLPATWWLEITATPEVLLIPRLLQKLAVPEIELLAVEYEAGVANGEARARLRFRAAPPRARLVAARLGKLVAIRAVRLRPDAPEKLS